MYPSYRYSPQVGQIMGGNKWSLDVAVQDIESERTKNIVTKATSKEDLENKVDNLFDSHKENVVNEMEKGKLRVKKLIPNDAKGRQDFENHILPPICGTLKSMETFMSSFVSKVGDFFVGCWNAIKRAAIWVADKVKTFAVFLAKGVASIFSWIF